MPGHTVFGMFAVDLMIGVEPYSMVERACQWNRTWCLR